MTFDRAWVLFLVWLPAAWVAWEWRDSARRGGLLLKAFGMLAILLALAEPRLTVYESKVALAVLVDTSASITPQDLERASGLATSIEKAKRSNWTQVLPFARNLRNPLPREKNKQGWKLEYPSGHISHGTNLEAAVREGLAALPAGLVPRVLLISDGNENLGSVTRAIWQAQQLGVPIDTMPLAGRPRPSLVLDSVSLPALVFTRRAVSRGRDTALAEDGRGQGGHHRGRKATRLQPSGVDGRREPFPRARHTDGCGGNRDGWYRQRRGSGRSSFRNRRNAATAQGAADIARSGFGTEEHLMRTLEANQFDVLRSSTGVPERLDEYQLVIFNNWSMESVSAERKEALEQFVKQGGGLLWVAGERNVYVEKKGEEDPLERSLPAKLAPPRTPEGTCVVLIIDKSSSMEGKKMELARLAAIGVVENLRPVDSVGVLIFDNSFQWAVPIRKTEDRMLIKRLISGITPDGGTQIAPALSEAYRRIVPQHAVYKHIVLLTDGISEEGDSMSLSREALANHVTISTVGLGQDVNRAFLEKVATLAQGKAYFLNDPSGIAADSAARRPGAHRQHRRRKEPAGSGSETGGDSGRRGYGAGAGFEGVCALPVAAFGRHDPERGSEGSTAGTLAIRAGTGGGLRLGREESLGGQLGELAWIRPFMDQYFPRPAAARRGQRSQRGVRPGEQ